MVIEPKTDEQLEKPITSPPIRSDNLQRLSEFLTQFAMFIESKQAARLADQGSFLKKFQALIDRVHSKAEFNLIDITGVGSSEVAHSSILAWLIDPREWHGCHELFLSSFLKACSIPIADIELRNCYVRKEFSGTESIIDIMVCGPGSFLVYIENKIDSTEGYDQLNREYRDMRRLGASMNIPNQAMFPVFLTINGYQATTGDSQEWRSVSYGDLAKTFESALVDIQDPKLSFLVKDLIDRYKEWSRT